MIKPVEMTQVRIISPSNKVRNVIETLYDMKILHIADFHKTDKNFFDIGKPFKDASVYSEQLLSIRAILSRLNVTGEPSHLKNFKHSQKTFLELSTKFKEISIELDKLKAEENKLLQELENPITLLDTTKGRMRDYKSLVFFAGTVKNPIESKIEAITKDYLLKQAEIGRRLAILLYVKKSAGEKVKSILSESGFTEHQLPTLSKSDIEKNLAKARNKMNDLGKQLENFKKANSKFLVDYESALMQLNEKAEVPLRFASSESTLIASGWVPTKTVETLKKNLDEIAKGKVSVETVPGKNPPTSLDNPKLTNPFEFLLNMYSLPRYREIDPTLLMFITFPLFFGFMLGDVGYGAVTLVMAFLLGRILPVSIRPLLQVITIAALATIAFGFVFGEAFGHEFIQHPILNRVHDINTMMLISVLVGIAHVNFGFMLGLINELKHHSFIQAFFRKGSWITLQVGVGILAFGFMQSSQLFQIAGGILSIVSVLMIIKGEGFLRIVELPALLSNILSYIRLFAIGLASVSLAAVVNELASGAFAQGGISLIFGVGILFVGHFINLLLGLLGPFLHSMRLHYVEFFQKFYEGGGYRYSPFGFAKTLGGR